jgi:phosphoglycerate kinase
VDFNVPLDGTRIVDDRRIRAALPTLVTLRARGARVLVATHLGRPKGKPVEELRVAPLAARLGELLGVPVKVAEDVAGPSARELVAAMHEGDVIMLENVRFEPGEERDDDELSGRLAALVDIYVDDAFGAAHRAHASTHGVARLRPAYAGLLMQRELEMLGGVLRERAHPLVAIIGGSKISTKLGVLKSLLRLVDTLWIGGAMACTFYRALGEETGTSLVEFDQVGVAAALLEESRADGAADLRLPVDVVVTRSPQGGEPIRTVAWKQIPPDEAVVDVGADTVAAIAADCQVAATVVWNGPLGIYEVDAFAQGTRGVAQALASSEATSVIGGGDLAAALEAAGVTDRISFISTGGGATLELLEGRVLPGVAVLAERPQD